jgi:hypothetical protein
MGAIFQNRTRTALLALAGACAVAAIAGLVWLFGALSDTFNHIMPGSANMASTSMEPYDLYFRTNYKSFKPLAPSAKPMEWHLRLPRAFVTVQHGSNGAVDLLGVVKSDHLFVDLDANLDSSGKVFVPSATLSADNIRKNSIIFFLKNQEAETEIANYDSCIPETKQGDIFKSRGRPTWSNQECSERFLRCTIFMHTDGWYIELGVTHDLFANTEKTCTLAHQFLDKYTVTRDDIR